MLQLLRYSLAIILILSVSTKAGRNVLPEDIEDNDFAEFEDFEEDVGKTVNDELAQNPPYSSPKSGSDEPYETDLDSVVEVILLF